MTLAAPGVVSDHRLDYLTAKGLGTWGDCRLTIVGTEGTIEARANVDVAGAEGAEHLIVVDADGTRRVDVSGVVVDWGEQLLADLADGGERLMTQQHAIDVTDVCLRARKPPPAPGAAPRVDGPHPQSTARTPSRRLRCVSGDPSTETVTQTGWCRGDVCVAFRVTRPTETVTQTWDGAYGSGMGDARLELRPWNRGLHLGGPGSGPSDGSPASRWPVRPRRLRRGAGRVRRRRTRPADRDDRPQRGGHRGVPQRVDDGRIAIAETEPSRSPSTSSSAKRSPPRSPGTRCSPICATT